MFAKTIEVFLVDLSSFPWRPYTHEHTFLVRIKDGMPSPGPALEKRLFCMSIFRCILHEQIKVVKENPSLVHIYLLYVGKLLSLAVQPNNSQKNVCINTTTAVNNDATGICEPGFNKYVLYSIQLKVTET